MQAAIFFFLMLLYGFGISAQQLHTVAGHVYINGSPTEAVNIQNLTQNANTITDSTGYFVIPADRGDSLVFSHINAVTLRIALARETMEEKNFKIDLLPMMNQLDEALVYSNKNISAVALGIIPKEIKPLTMNERRLKTAGDFKAAQLLGILGGGVPINPIINKISGRTKRLKKIVAQERISINYERLRKSYSAFIMENIDISEADMGRFMYFLADNEVTSSLLEQKNDEALQLFILENWITFQNLGEKE